MKPFAVISTGYNWQFDRTTYNGVTTKGRLNYLNYGGGAGLAWFPSKKVGLFTQLTYDRLYSDMMDQGALNLNFGVQINLGGLKIGGRYVIGLANINDIDNEDKWKNQGFQLYAAARIF